MKKIQDKVTPIKDQENASGRESSVSEEELSSEDEIENAPELSATSDAITLLMTSNSDQSSINSNSSRANRTAM